MTVHGAMDIHEIMRHLPHRYPFLLVDRVLECEPGKRIEAIKNVTINEPFFQGHFPGYPVMPGVLIIEAMAQVSAILAYMTLAPGARRQVADLLRRHRQRALPAAGGPGRPAACSSRWSCNVVRGVGKFAAKASVGDELVAEAELMAAVRDADGRLSCRARPSHRPLVGRAAPGSAPDVRDRRRSPSSVPRSRSAPERRSSGRTS